MRLSIRRVREGRNLEGGRGAAAFQECRLNRYGQAGADTLHSARPSVMQAFKGGSFAAALQGLAVGFQPLLAHLANALYNEWSICCVMGSNAEIGVERKALWICS